MALHNPQY